VAADDIPLTLILPSDLRLLPVVRAFVQAACQVCGVESCQIHAVVLAADEAANNVIRHAHHNDASLSLQLQCFLATNHIEIRVLDEGEPFDLASVPQLDPGELRIGGRGVYLMRALMDEVSCTPRGLRGNLLRLIKRW
jgi:serine/threonine-protein kinase RsbW